MAERIDLGRATDLSPAQPLTRNAWLAIDVATDPVAHAVSLQRVHELSLTGSCRPAGIREVVAASWTRSLAAGVVPEAAGAPVVLADTELDAARAASALAPLIDTILLSLASLASLASLDAGAPHVIAIGDSEANLLWVAGDGGHRRGRPGDGFSGWRRVGGNQSSNRRSLPRELRSSDPCGGPRCQPREAAAR